MAGSRTRKPKGRKRRAARHLGGSGTVSHFQPVTVSHFQPALTHRTVVTFEGLVRRLNCFTGWKELEERRPRAVR